MGGFVPMMLMQLGEVVFGGVPAAGLYGMLMFAHCSQSFIAGLMIGRTPEYLSARRSKPSDMKMGVGCDS